MAAATAGSGSQARGSSSPTAVAKAKAEAECPEGNDVEPGILTLRPAGRVTPALSGRARLSSPLPTRLAVAEASPMLATPSTAARRGSPRVRAGAAGAANPTFGGARARAVGGLVDLVELAEDAAVDGGGRRRPRGSGGVSHCRYRARPGWPWSRS